MRQAMATEITCCVALARRHPAPLGHEVIGNQVAYYHLKLMQQALEKVIEDSNGKLASARRLGGYLLRPVVPSA